MKRETEPASEPVPAPTTASEDETVEPFRVLPPRPVAVDVEPATEPVEEPVTESETVDIPPVPVDVDGAARALGVQVWSGGMVPFDELYRGRQAHFVDQYKAHAAAMGWIVDDADRIIRGEVDPRPVTVTAIPNY